MNSKTVLPKRSRSVSTWHNQPTHSHKYCKKVGIKLQFSGNGAWGDEEEYLSGNRAFNEVLIHDAGEIGQKYRGSYANFPPNQEKEDLF